MTKLTAYQVDAFTSELFKGNPASVVILNEELSDEIMMKIARENALPETAFILGIGDKNILRWFTPDIEMDLCGHATLATAHVLFTENLAKENTINFNTRSGVVTVTKNSQKYNYVLELPKRAGVESSLPTQILESINHLPKEVYLARDFMLVYQTQKEVETISFDRSILDQLDLDTGGIIITSTGDSTDFVSRFFTPGATIFEDPVTGSAHSTLVPYWEAKLGRSPLNALQLSQRGGSLICSSNEKSVFIQGSAITYSKSEIYL